MKIRAENGDIILSDVFNGVDIETDTGVFGVVQRDGGIEVLRDGVSVWSSENGPTKPSPEDRGRRSRVADLAWRLTLWADKAEQEATFDRIVEARAYRAASEEIIRMGKMCWHEFDVERDRRRPMLR